MPRTGLTLRERRAKWGREGMAVRLYDLDAAGRKAMIAPAQEAVRRRCEAEALAEFRSRGKVPTAAELAAARTNSGWNGAGPWAARAPRRPAPPALPPSAPKRPQAPPALWRGGRPARRV